MRTVFLEVEIKCPDNYEPDTTDTPWAQLLADASIGENGCEIVGISLPIDHTKQS